MDGAGTVCDVLALAGIGCLVAAGFRVDPTLGIAATGAACLFIAAAAQWHAQDRRAREHRRGRQSGGPPTPDQER
ncbi:MAG: hypothetical protein ACK4WH_00905 [Phycisphaerales bacterium]